MSLRNTLPLILIALTKFTNAATPPACLLDAINTQPNPADLRHICIYRAAEVRNEIANICGGSDTDTDTDDEDEHDEAQRAVAAFEEVCGPLTASTSTLTTSTSSAASSTTTDEVSTTAAPTSNTSETTTAPSTTETATPTTTADTTAVPTAAAARTALGSFGAIAVVAAGMVVLV
ncbi:hypothetical protein W97_01993 [Coniosporium apollinis CBS 100218]|uniref:Extracellular membrane protein CFEM domain-containing protein n=1 Tax=Coniosporium apollinis (strain CBS 100218) TaxID=1168221 RepID=R7YLL7_CONA1|nr:uncharacterized protein W97_01993 [Coniosporium apollinis CBS 100218]EON62768.1 hypothetical protein W97_01993 [Coniosporium apollinis CBS 100218]